MEKKDILMPIRRPWPDMILSGRKPFEFRNRVGRYWLPGSRSYIYESKGNGGSGMVVGDAVIENIQHIPSGIIGPPRFLLRYWVEHISKDDGKWLPLLDELGGYELPHYKRGTILRYLGRPDLLRKAMASGKWVRMDKEGDNPISDCEEWLREIGLINDFGEYCYSHALKLKDTQRYEQAKPLSDFGMARAPQNWAYVKEVIAHG